MAVNLMGDSAWGGGNWWEEDTSDKTPAASSAAPTTTEAKDTDLEAGNNNKYSKSQSVSADGASGPPVGEDPFKEAFEADDDPEAYMGIYDSIKANIDKIDANEQEIAHLRASYLESTQSKEKQEIMERFEKIMSNNRDITKSLQTQLKASKNDNDTFKKEHKGSSVAQWRENQLNSCTRRFKTSTNAYQKELKEFQNELKKTQRRQIGVVAENMTEAEQDKLAENYEAADQFLKQQFDLTDVSDQMQDRLAELEARHNGMIQIEQGVKELQEMWNELHTLIIEQQELLDNIENNVLQTKDYVSSGVKHIEKAEKEQKTTRKLTFCFLCFLLIVAAIIVGFLSA